MRFAPALLVAVALGASPALAQDAIKAADIGPNIDRDLWCASAFTLTAYIAEQNNDAATAAADTDKMQTLYNSIVTTMKAGGFEQAQFNELNKQYSSRVMNPFAAANDGYSAEICNSAAIEAEVALAAAAAAEAAAAPATDAPAAAPAPTTP